MAKALGVGVFRSRDPKGDWYQQHRGVPVEHPCGATFLAAAMPPGGLSGALAQVRVGGAEVDEKIEEREYGRFGWFTDPDGNRVELWQPPAP